MAQKETHFFVGSYVETYESYAFRLTSSFVPDLLHVVDFDGLRSKTSDGRLTILDAAAGTGAVSLALAQKFPQDRIIATDNSPEMLAMLSRKADAQGVKNVEVVTADLLDHSAVPTASVDVLFVNFGMFFIDDISRPKSWSELARVLKPGGIIALTCWKKVSTTEWLRSSISAVDPTYDLTKGTFLLAYRLADDADLKKQMEAAGFSDINVSVKHHSVMFPRDKFVSLVLPAGIVNANFQDEETRKKIYQAGEERFNKEFSADAAEIPFEGDAGVVFARRV